MKKIAPETERKLMAVIEKTAAFVNDGMTPNDAIIKAAAEGAIRPGEISLVVHAYNTGRTSRQRQDGADPFEKAAEFALADTETILEKMYPTVSKTAAATSRSTAVSPEYSYSPAPMLARKASYEKRAGNVDWRLLNGVQITAPAPLPTDPQHRQKVAAANIERLKTHAEESRRKAAAAFDQMGRTFNDLTTYFRQPGSHPLAVVKEAVLLMHGDKGGQIMDELVHVTPNLTKLAGHGSSVSVDTIDCSLAPFPLIATFLTQIDDYREKRAAYQTATVTFEKEAGKASSPFAGSAGPSILDQSFDSWDKTANLMGSLKTMGAYSAINDKLMQPIAAKLKGPDDSIRVNKAVTDLNDPNHEQQLRAINTQAMLQDLMLNDPVISGYDPHEVTGAFNDINQISPSVADQRMLMQSLLRKRLQQGQLDTFEQDQLLGFEDKLRRQFQPIAGGKADASII